MGLCLVLSLEVAFAFVARIFMFLGRLGSDSEEEDFGSHWTQIRRGEEKGLGDFSHLFLIF